MFQLEKKIEGKELLFIIDPLGVDSFPYIKIAHSEAKLEKNKHF